MPPGLLSGGSGKAATATFKRSVGSRMLSLFQDLIENRLRGRMFARELLP
ncbi:hypothetical protein AHiyo6_07420 [Arthrobacter sp. Hiyo6]|nr:hypothetical protein AHiyo6_07420 [Arthrobacter sp. Hiyo6]